MARFKSLELSTLIEMLSDFQVYLTEMLTTDLNKDSIETCNNTIQLLQTEIDYRQMAVINH
ncbi:MAG: hypothetical protein ACHQFX_02635 [Chitinophagales bacterium]